MPTTTDTAPIPAAGVAVEAPGGLGGWYASLSSRDRAVYAAMLGMLALIIAIYLFAGLRALFSGGGSIGERPTGLPAPTSTQPVVAVATTAPTAAILPTPTDLPSPTSETLPTDIPPTEVLIAPPTSAPTNPPATTTVPATPPATSVPTSASAGPSPSPVAGQPTSAPVTSPTESVITSAAPTQRPTSVPQTAPPALPTSVPQTAPPALPTSTPQTVPPALPTSAPQAAPPALPTSAPQTAPPALPTSAPQIAAGRRPITLYFADTTGTLYVPVRRAVQLEGQHPAEVAVRSLIEGPRNGLTPLVAPDARLLGITIAADGTAFVNFDRPPASDDFGLDSIVLTLTDTEFRGLIQRVQMQVNGQYLGGPRARPVVNPINPDGLERDVAVTEFLPLYFVSNDGAHHVRVIRMVWKTKQTADATMRALLEGPIGYEYALRRSIPEGTELRGVRKDGSTIWVDFTQPFADAPDRVAAVRTVVESLTTLPGVSGVRFLVEGASLADQWGADYGRLFTRPPINPE